MAGRNEGRGKRLARYLLLPTLIQFAILFASVALFSRFVGRGNGAPLLMPEMDAGGEATDPNAVRLAYMLLACALGIALAALAERLGGSARRQAGVAAFWLAAVGGMLLWQGLGECAWHFGVPLLEGPGAGFRARRYVMLPRLESAAGWLFFLPVAALSTYCRRRGGFSEAVWAFVLSFLGNWFGHIAMIGTYPFVSGFFTELAWFRISGPVVGAAISALALWEAMRRDADAGALRVWSLVLYTGLGIVAMGLRGG